MSLAASLSRWIVFGFLSGAAPIQASDADSRASEVPAWLPPDKAALYIYRPKGPFNGGWPIVFINGQRRLEPKEGEHGVLVLAPGAYEVKIAGESAGSWWPKDTSRSIEVSAGREYFLRFFAALPPGVRPGPHLLFNNVSSTVMSLVPGDRGRAEIEGSRLVGSEEYFALLSAARNRSSPGAEELNEKYPKVGDRWEYVYVDSTTKRHRRVAFEVKSIGKEHVEETMVLDGGPAQTFRHEPAVRLSFNRLWVEFAPYLLALNASNEGSWARVPLEGIPSCARGGVSCRATAQLAGEGTTSTSAGTFPTLKVLVTVIAEDLRRDALGQNYHRELTYWYSERAKRVVKLAARTLSGNSIDEDYEVELATFELH